MAQSRYFTLIRDLLNFLPGNTPSQWEKPDQADAAAPIVVIIPGFQAKARPLSVIRRRFLRDGFSVIVLSMEWLTFSDGIIGLYRMAKRLSGIILTLRKRVGMKTPIYLVGHSAGGLVARYYVQLLGGYHYCDGLATLGTPHHGTWIAILGFFSHLVVKARCLFQMLPVSPFIRRLNKAPFPRRFRFVSIYSKDDFFCSKDVLSSEKVNNVELETVSHSEFLLSKRAYSELLNRLELSQTVVRGEDSSRNDTLLS